MTVFLKGFVETDYYPSCGGCGGKADLHFDTAWCRDAMHRVCTWDVLKRQICIAAFGFFGNGWRETDNNPSLHLSEPLIYGDSSDFADLRF